MLNSKDLILGLSLIGVAFLSACDSSFSSSSSNAIIYTGAVRVAHSPIPSSAAGASRPNLSGPFISSSFSDGSALLSDGNQTLRYDVLGDSWTDAGIHLIDSSAAVTLTSGNRLLVTGGLDGSFNGLTSVATYDPQANHWSSVAPMLTGRGLHSAALLQNGQIMVSGGETSSGVVSGASEIFDGTSWQTKSPMNVPRALHILAGLPDGRVVAAGGTDGSQYLRSTEIFNMAANQWTAAGDFPVQKLSERFVSLPDGRIVSSGGTDMGGIEVNSAEIFSPATNAWSVLPSMGFTRRGHTMGLLPDGRVIVAGGWGDNGSSSGYLTSTEIFDPQTLSWSFGPDMSDSRGDHQMSITPDGRVILFGGRYGSMLPLASTEIIDLFPTKVSLTSSGGKPPYTYTKLSGAGFVYGETYFTSLTGDTVLSVRDSKGLQSIFTITVE